MKKILFVLSLMLACCVTYAHHENPSYQWRPADLIMPADGPLQHTLFDPAVYRFDGTRSGSVARFRVKESQALVTLFTNPYLTTPYADAYAVSIRFKITYKDLAGVERTTENITLNVNYDPEGGHKYQAKDSYHLPGVHHAVMKIDSIAVTKADGTALPVASLNDLFLLRFQLQIERYYEPQPAVVPVVNLVRKSLGNGHLRFSWQGLPWAEKYDLEWMYVDDYDYATGSAIHRSNLAYRFKNNSTRIRTEARSYEIPMVFERGFVIFRVRGVGMWGENFTQEVPGAWSLPEAGLQIPPVVMSPRGEVPNGVFQITETLQHDASKNWQYTANFTEKGKRVDDINYLDGTLRSRQALTNLSSSSHVIVGETIYDHQGRAAIEILPSPYRPPLPSTTPTPGTYRSRQPALHYVPNYNAATIAGTDIPYRQEHFDKDRSEGCDLAVTPLATSRGTGNYYSPNNPDVSNAQAYVPDANGYPFKHTEYTPDKTGRIRRQGMAGQTFQLGQGHETKYFYAVPGQQELDRIFGNEAGIAAHYKKEMMLDANGQAHISYKDGKGKTIATALAGQAPGNLEAIDAPEPQSITLNLLEEENRRETGTASLISSRSIVISQPTTIDFRYQLTPGTTTNSSCPADGTICYDCVYDLTIQVYDDCGQILYDVSERIGTLDEIRNCNPIVFTRNAELSLTPGSYTVSKRLTVNPESIDRYVRDYLTATCHEELLEELIETEEGRVDSSACEAQCKTCKRVELEASYTMVQADGSERVMTVPVEVRAQNDGTCVNTCAASAGGCNFYYESMLADMAPTGQYALYRDTMRREMDPRGEIRPASFPLSILNERNRLPVKNVSWRNPVFDYRNANGNLAYIEINEAGQPAHLEREILEEDGKRYVKPQYLNDVRDFITYWQPSWAESLVAYHPEYQYYLWCKEQRTSHQYDSTMRATKTYAVAAANNMVNHRTLRLTNDPFFSAHPSAIPMMMDSLNRFFKMDTLSRPVFNIDETTYLVINCNNINFTETQVITCARGMSPYVNPARANKEWELYKELYLSMKLKVMDVVRHRDVMTRTGFNNLCIGSGSHSSLLRLYTLRLSDLILYRNKTRRFVDAQDAFTYRPVAPTDPSSEEQAGSWRSFINHARQSQYQRCGTCPVASDFLALLNGFAVEGRLTDAVNLPDAPPLTLTRALVDAFSIRDALSYSWNPIVSGGQLKIEVKAKGSQVCTFEMKQEGPPVDWKKIKFFISISAAGSANKFRLRALTAEGEEIIITGYSSCLDITKCSFSPVCQATPLLSEMKTFMSYLLTGRRYQQSSLRIYTTGDRTTSFGSSLREQHADYQTWDWQFVSSSGGNYNGNIVITKPGDGILSLAPVRQTCNFNFKVQNGYGLSDVFSIVEIRRATASPNEQQQCKQYGFVLVAMNTKGIRFTIQVSNTCYVVSECCNKQPIVSCEIPFTPRINLIDPCFENALGQARANARRMYDDSLRSETIRMRNRYVEHCLNAAERFTLNYSENIYQYTLYYYDQSGNLVQTVPPKGVDLLNASELNQVARARTTPADDNVYPDHQLKTVYKYNTLNQALSRTTPDGGTIKYCYDELGRVILSQTSQQAAESTCSYTIYDALGKVIEAGKINARTGDFPSSLTYTQFRTDWLSGTRTEIFKTFYDHPVRDEINIWFNNEPLHLRNRVATVTYQESARGNYDHATHYRYDILGNVRALIQENALLARMHPVVAEGGHHIKKVRYDYDLASGNVNRIVYQPDQPDQFIHEYDYDADNRMISVRTSTREDEDELIKDIDATFRYYKHGALARQTLGMEKVQGLDFAYTLQGWLKGINATTLSPYRDIGRDATATGGATRGVVAQDAFGYSLQYFSNDYRPIGIASIGSEMFTPTSAGSDLDAISLYDGNISHEVIGNDAFADNKVQAQAYRYDQLSRLSGMRIFRKADVMTSNAWRGGSFGDSYQTSYSYDANGNITNLTRKDGDGSVLDDLTYNYANGHLNNQLTSIHDAVSTADNADLETQPDNNYLSDRDGRLVRDQSAGVNTIHWNNADKIKEIRKSDDTIRFAYDSKGRRVIKTASDYTTYDVLDNVGNILSSYKVKNDTILWQYAPIYSDKRIGVYNPGMILSDTTKDERRHIQLRGQKHYELTGRTGNVLATILDRKVPSTLSGAGVFYADISSASDYYPFGMIMPDRKLDSLKYAFGFQGMVKDDDVKGDGNSYTTEFRQYDPRIGRWISLDPAKSPSASPYHAFSNNPVRYTDPKGDTIDLPGVLCPECTLTLGNSPIPTDTRARSPLPFRLCECELSLDPPAPIETPNTAPVQPIYIPDLLRPIPWLDAVRILGLDEEVRRQETRRQTGTERPSPPSEIPRDEHGRIRLLVPPIPPSLITPPTVQIDPRVRIDLGVMPDIRPFPFQLRGGTFQLSITPLPPPRYRDPEEDDHDREDDHH